MVSAAKTIPSSDGSIDDSLFSFPPRWPGGRSARSRQGARQALRPGGAMQSPAPAGHAAHLSAARRHRSIATALLAQNEGDRRGRRSPLLSCFSSISLSLLGLGPAIDAVVPLTILADLVDQVEAQLFPDCSRENRDRVCLPARGIHQGLDWSRLSQISVWRARWLSFWRPASSGAFVHSAPCPVGFVLARGFRVVHGQPEVRRLGLVFSRMDVLGVWHCGSPLVAAPDYPVPVPQKARSQAG